MQKSWLLHRAATLVLGLICLSSFVASLVTKNWGYLVLAGFVCLWGIAHAFDKPGKSPKN